MKRLTIVRSLTAIAGTATLTVLTQSVSGAQATGQAAPPAAAQTAGKRAIIPAGGRAGGMLSPGIMVGNTLYMSGQLPAGNMRDSGITAQTKSALERFRPVLEAAGMTFADVVSVQVYLVDVADFTGFNAAYREVFTTDPRPTRTTVVVRQLVQEGARVELTMTAVKTP